MKSLVQELQQAALDEKSSAGSLLRKALVVASKLGVSDFETWARKELEGYNPEEVPEYRRVRGSPVVWNTYRKQHEHLRFSTPAGTDRLSTMRLPYSVDELEEPKSRKPGDLMLTYSAAVEHELMSNMQFPSKPSLKVPESAVRGILGRVRTIVLEWAIKLDKLGVVGKGMTFSETERQQASSVHIDTFIQGITGSQIQVNSPGATQQQAVTPEQLADLKALIELVAAAVRSAAVDSEQVRELRAEIETLGAQLDSPKPKRSIVKEALSSVRTILEGAGGELLATNLPQAIHLVSGLLQSFGQ
jgi:hypothetical protein